MMEMSNLVGTEGGKPLSGIRKEEVVSAQQDIMINPAILPGSVTVSQSSESTAARKRKFRRTIDPLTTEIIELPPSALLASHNFVCRVCSKSFQREQNLQLHMRGHKLPWKLKMRTVTEERNKIYICPEATCQRHNPAFGLGDFPGIRKHFCRKHGERKWKCDNCPKAYAVHCDWKAHTKICGQKKYKCECGSSYARKVRFMAHKRACKGPAKEEDEVNLRNVPPHEGNVQHADHETGSGAGGVGSVFQMPDLNHVTGYATGSNFTVLDLNHQTRKLRQVASSADRMAISCMNMEGRYLVNSTSLFGQTLFNSYSLDLYLGSYGTTRFNYMNYANGRGSSSGNGAGGDDFYRLGLASMQRTSQMDAISSINSTTPKMLYESFVSPMAGSAESFVSTMAGSSPIPIYKNWSYAGSSSEQMISTDQLTRQAINEEQYHQIPHPFEVGGECYSTHLQQNQIKGFLYQYSDNITVADSLLFPNDLGVPLSSAAPWLPMGNEHCFHGNLVFGNTDEFQNQELNTGIQGMHQLAQTGASTPGFVWDGIAIGTDKPQTGDGIGTDFSGIGPEPWMVYEAYRHHQLPTEFNHANQQKLQNEQLPHSGFFFH